jgi:ABC-type phosphate/phosphonate transport system substrate-binding protein
MPVASLPMYDWPEVRWATDALWTAIASELKGRGIAAPDALDRSRAFGAEWLDPGLVFSQICGWPYATRLRGKVRLVATPIYAVEGCEGSHYSSVIVAGRGEGAGGLAAFRGRRIAFNSDDSLSGYIALRAAMRQASIDPAAETWVETGSHRASVRAVAEGAADVAAIDAVCWALAERFEPEAVSRLHVVGRTPFRPGLPYVTARDRTDAEVALLRSAVAAALASSGTEAARSALRLSGLAVLDEADYARIASLAH